jgi:hypothetical protein
MELMAEDPERQRRRSNLTRERAKLSQAQEWINSIHQKDDDEDMALSEDTVGDGFSPMEDWTDECI